jgi:hypothetical protein
MEKRPDLRNTEGGIDVVGQVLRLRRGRCRRQYPESDLPSREDTKGAWGCFGHLSLFLLLC